MPENNVELLGSKRIFVPLAIIVVLGTALVSVGYSIRTVQAQGEEIKSFRSEVAQLNRNVVELSNRQSVLDAQYVNIITQINKLDTSIKDALSEIRSR